MNINTINTVSSSEVSGAGPGFPVSRNTTEKPEKLQNHSQLDQNTQAVTEKDGTTLHEAMEMAEVLNEYMGDLQTNIGFYIRKDLNHQVVVEIKDRKTDELIKQIPTEEMLKIKEKMEELTGLIFDQSV